MAKENDNPEVWGFFKRGDIVLDFKGSVWGNKKFELHSFNGNAYCPLVSAYFLGAEKKNSNMCNLGTDAIRLIGAKKRPLINVKTSNIIKLRKLGNVEAKREFAIRLNNKKL